MFRNESTTRALGQRCRTKVVENKLGKFSPYSEGKIQSGKLKGILIKTLSLSLSLSLCDVINLFETWRYKTWGLYVVHVRRTRQKSRSHAIKKLDAFSDAIRKSSSGVYKFV